MHWEIKNSLKYMYFINFINPIFLRFFIPLVKTINSEEKRHLADYSHQDLYKNFRTIRLQSNNEFQINEGDGNSKKIVISVKNKIIEFFNKKNKELQTTKIQERNYEWILKEKIKSLKRKFYNCKNCPNIKKEDFKKSINKIWMINPKTCLKHKEDLLVIKEFLSIIYWTQPWI